MDDTQYSYLRRFGGPILVAALFGLSLYVLATELHDYSAAEIRRGLLRIHSLQLTLAFIITVASYFVLTGFDMLALRYVGRKLSYLRVGVTSFIAYALVHNLGFSVITGTVVRYRLLSPWGLSPLELTQAIAFNGVIFWLGFSLFSGLVLLLYAPNIPILGIESTLAGRGVGLLIFLGALSALVFWSRAGRGIRFREWEFPPPPPPMVFIGVCLAALDWTLAAAVAYVLLPTGDISFFSFVSIFLFSQIAGLVSHVPGGLGVFESLMLVFLGSHVDKPQLMAGLVVYRLVYYLVPLSTALCLFAAVEIRRKRHHLLLLSESIQARTSAVIPAFLAVMLFGLGSLLLFSSALPVAQERIDLLNQIVPLPVIELSHFTSGLAGMTLLILARGIFRRLDGAFVLTAIVLAIASITALTRAFDLWESLALLLLLVLLLSSRREFYRSASLLREPLSPRWILSLLLVGLATSWLIFFRFKHVEYSHELWWEFSPSSHAPRALRAMAGAFSLAFIYGLLSLLSSANEPPSLAKEEEITKALGIARRSSPSASGLVALGDKSVLLGDTENAFLMYSVEGKSWIALGDPIGESNEAAELIWRFCDRCDQYGSLPVFYEVGTQYLPTYIETGLELLKLGEEAIVMLSEFSLDGKSRSSLRHSRNRVLKEGWKLRFAQPEEVAALMPQLSRISEAWLKAKNTREKGFSLGYFDPTYLSRFPLVLVERDGDICAFANVWSGDGKTELSVDLMRYSELAPHGVMDYLFTEMMLWGREQGYARFSMGMAPFSGFEPHQVAPLWTKLATVLYQRGEKLYNFQGLRQYKEKFGPVWEPRFLAAPGGFALARVLTNLASLISGGVRGIISK